MLHVARNWLLRRTITELATNIILLNSEMRHALNSSEVMTINSHRRRGFLIKDRPITRTSRTLWHLAPADAARDNWEWKPIWEVKMSNYATAHCDRQKHSPQPCWPLTMLQQQSDCWLSRDRHGFTTLCLSNTNQRHCLAMRLFKDSKLGASWAPGEDHKVVVSKSWGATPIPGGRCGKFWESYTANSSWS